MPPCPLVIALVPLKYFSGNSQFPRRVPFTKEKMPWCPRPFKNEAYRPVTIPHVHVRFVTGILVILTTQKIELKQLNDIGPRSQLPIHKSITSSEMVFL